MKNMKKSIIILASAALALIAASCAKLDPVELPGEEYQGKAYVTIELKNDSGSSTTLAGRTVNVKFNSATIQRTTDAEGKIKDLPVAVPVLGGAVSVSADTGWAGGEGFFFYGSGSLSNKLQANEKGILTVSIKQSNCIK